MMRTSRQWHRSWTLRQQLRRSPLLRTQSSWSSWLCSQSVRLSLSLSPSPSPSPRPSLTQNVRSTSNCLHRRFLPAQYHQWYRLVLSLPLCNGARSRQPSIKFGVCFHQRRPHRCCRVRKRKKTLIIWSTNTMMQHRWFSVCGEGTRPGKTLRTGFGLKSMRLRQPRRRWCWKSLRRRKFRLQFVAGIVKSCRHYRTTRRGMQMKRCLNPRKTKIRSTSCLHGRQPSLTLLRLRICCSL